MRKLLKTKFFFKIIFFLYFFSTSICTARTFTQENILELPNLSPRNKIFVNFMQEIEKSYQKIAASKNIDIKFYWYYVTEKDTLMQIAARCSIPYEEIALLNDIENIDENIIGKKIIIPNAPGIFVPEKPTTSIGTLLKKRVYTFQEDLCYNILGRKFIYIPNERLTPTERAFFLDSALRIPLANSVLTSNFGIRTSPITGNLKFHKGIDLAAPMGTDVMACKAGIVANASYDKIYGNFVILDHDNNTQSVYAHLSDFFIKKGDIINGGQVIGSVGTTGASTGPHLHFEIRVNGKAQDPKRLLPTF